jgi:hypothetical protein
MHKHRPCNYTVAEVEEDTKKAVGWKPAALPDGWNKRWRANSSYHNKHDLRAKRLRKRLDT